MVSDEAVFYSTNPLETVEKALKRLNIELVSLLKVWSQTLEIQEKIKVLMEDICHYGVSGIFNYHIYSFIIFIFILLYILNKKPFIFYRSF